MSTFEELPQDAACRLQEGGQSPAVMVTPPEMAEEPFIFVSRRKNGRKQRPQVVIQPPPQPLGLSKTPVEIDNDSLPGWTSKKPAKIKKNSQRAKIQGLEGTGQGKRSIEWGLSMMEDRITTLKQSKFYHAFRELVQLDLQPPCSRQGQVAGKTEQVCPSAVTKRNPTQLASVVSGSECAEARRPKCELNVHMEETAGDHVPDQAISEMLCYGIGSIESSRNSQYQLALGLCMKEILQIPGKISIFDPIMTEYDKQLAEQLGLSVLKDKDQAKKAIETRTLLYMPHCPRGLYSLVLETNWTRVSLNNLVILGNRFTMYDESPSFRQFAKQAPFLLPALSIARVSLLPQIKFEDNTIYNDLAFHSFPADKALPVVDVLEREDDPEML
ncbi:hypothetical protein BGZ58_007590 [Dissophora ornata]|nr:hypothetical protein BGZ58_007590 [Dissophora ornata]